VNLSTLFCSLLLLLLSSSALSGCAGSTDIRRPDTPRAVATLTLDGQFSIAPLGRYPPITGLPFGGISALAPAGDGTEIFGLSDARRGGRIYRLFVEGTGGSMKVTATSLISLELGPRGLSTDHEGLVILPSGNFLVCSEGTTVEPRLPPVLEEYGRRGEFMRGLTIPDHFVPEPTGPQARGARGNAGFEALAISPDGGRLFVGTESPLVQDGSPASFDAGARVRILEYSEQSDTYEASREFAYDLEPVHKPAYQPGTAVNGLVDLVAIDRTTLLALERSFVANPADPAASANRIRIYRLTLAGATNIAGVESLKGRTDVVPVSKTLLLDLADVGGLSPDLAPTLDNFEGMAFGPRLADGRASLILVSDDNFSAAQRTWFLMFAIQ
jgi:hypothetical protein